MVLAALADLVLPTGCAGCGAQGTPRRRGVCAACAAAIGALTPHAVRPTPAPPGLPPCAALGPYGGELRELVLSYKDRGRHGLARPLGTLLAGVVLAVADTPVLLVPVPDTAKAARERHGDHMARLARQAARTLSTAGHPAEVAYPLIARPKADSAHLNAAERAAAAAHAFATRRGRVESLRRKAAGRAVVILDDVVTTGVTLAAVTEHLQAAGVRPNACATLAATVRRSPGQGEFPSV
ncbi:putative amidophosphoribosyltransferase [Allocatelliglobosispora scoriae]|uniref:Putative amidophosphoribosyltransferase n=1 Tax=Allocatelliglobosispora scoriae TaxID=643052 RepID=A0A841BPN9_9ACTN|nr:phosphoribosyltransferase family protein [Allocatelliglobosispora scoriae]MBB5870234.1 putative amidophosphoribosyltransferase [Allocatelliglobosispora scoriae]